MELFILLVWLLGSSVCGYVASQKGRSGFWWPLIALIISPLLALIAIAALPAVRDEDADRIKELEEEVNRLRGDESTRPPWARPKPKD